MNKAKVIIGSLVAAGVVGAGGAYISSSNETDAQASVMELAKKKKNKKKNKNKTYYYQQNNRNNTWRDNSSYNQQNIRTERYENSNVKYDERIGLPAMRNNGGMILHRRAYTSLYSKEMRIPLWTAWHLTASHTSGHNKRNQMQFAEDNSVGHPRATNFDYMSSGYDRGHMCPAGDNKWDRQALSESFLFSNCCPQLHSLNSGDWNDLEIKCREWAQRYGDIYIVCGPILRGHSHKTIGKNRVVVPEGFFKVVLCMRGTPKAIGFVYEHRSGHRSMSSYVCSVDEVERITGYDFYAALSDDIERRVEATASFSNWR